MKRDKYILHYVVRGKGEFCGKKFCENNCYIAVPNELETIVADDINPYESYWIMFRGTGAINFLKKCNLPIHNDVFKFDKVNECAEILKNALININPSNELEEAAIMNAALHQIMALHFTDFKASFLIDNMAQRVMKFINENYYNNISVDCIAKHFNYSRNYLYSLFKNEYGISPQAYMLHLRIEKAKELLLNEKHLLISEIALAAGYGDARYFSRLFRKKVGVSPKDFIKMHK
jgi:AraC-like DNA-binding protein